jgi:hypothetical protein
MDTRSAKYCGMGVSICFFLYIKNCHGVIRQYRIILSADTASEVPQLPERCLSRKAGIMRYYHKAFLPQKSPAKTAKVLLTMLANVVYYT